MSVTTNDLQNILKSIKNETKYLEGKTILISGGAGFIGSYINAVFYLLNKKVFKKKCKIISVDNYITGSKENFLLKIRDKNFNFLHSDIRLPYITNEKVHYIIHAAGLASPYYYMKYPLETIESAVIGAKNLLEVARANPVKGFLFFSSSEIYGDPEPEYVPTKETYTGKVSSIGPRACYDESKRLAETLCTVYFEEYGVPIKIIRPFNVYGPGMKHTDYRVIPNFVYNGLLGKNLPVHDKGAQTRTFCYITDAVSGIFKVLVRGKSGQAYNVGNDKPEITMFELASIISKLIGNNVKPRRKKYPKNYPAGEPQRRCPDLSKIKKLSYTPKVDLETGLKRTIIWFKKEYNL